MLHTAPEFFAAHWARFWLGLALQSAPAIEQAEDVITAETAALQSRKNVSGTWTISVQSGEAPPRITRLRD